MFMNCFDPNSTPEPGKPILLVVAVALVDADGRVLLAQRPEGKSLAGLWEFPGGKVHEGESPEYALVRELREELGIETAGSCLAPFTFASHSYESFHLLMPLYVCRGLGRHADAAGRADAGMGAPQRHGPLPDAPGGQAAGRDAARPAVEHDDGNLPLPADQRGFMG